MIEIGFFALLLGLCLSVYGFAMGIVSLRKPVRPVIASARNALTAVSWCVTFAVLTLMAALVTHDFSVRYVFRNTSIDMPPWYLVSAAWSALEGSHTLWTFIMTTLISVALATVRPKNEQLLPGLLTAFGLVLTFMLLLCVWSSAPLTRMFPIGQVGIGMNALLQNPYMAIHPPALFTGYCALVVPFGYAAAALLRGAFTPDWLVTFRRWTLLGWAILTVGIFLGGKWAYVELGWAGYWAWDPVENSSFMPWLATTSSIHTFLILDKTGRLPRLATFLAMLAFSLTFMGTFITRSGVISSVHSFAESNIGPIYLTFIAVLFTLMLVLVFTRGHLLQGAAKENTWTVSKESTLLFTNYFLLFLLALVLIGTLLPLIVEAVRGEKISIQQPFFNAFAPWIAVGLVSILGIGNLLRWRSGKITDPLVSLLVPALWSVALTTALVLRKNLDIKSTVGFALVLWTAGVMLMDLYQKLRTLKFNGNVFLKYNRPYLGSWIVHMGFLVSIAGFIGNYRTIEAHTTLNLGESTEFFGYKLTNKGLSYESEYNYNLVKANIEAENAKGEVVTIQPIRSKYTNKEDWLNEIGISSTFWHDVYLALSSFDTKTQQVQLNMHINPTVKLVWTSLVIMVIGAMVGLTHKIRRRSIDADPNQLELETATTSIESFIGMATEHPAISGKSFATSIVILFAAASLTGFGFSGVAFADAAVTKMNPQVQDIGSDLRCPTCGGLSIVESSSAQSLAMRAEIESQLVQGKSKSDILQYFTSRYGEWIMRKPDFQSKVGFFVWIIPIAGLIFGPLILIFGLKKSRDREIVDLDAIRNEIRQFVQRSQL